MEVLELLRKRAIDRATSSTPRKKGKNMKHRDGIEQAVVEYLEATRCVRVRRRDELLSVLQSRKKRKRMTGFALTEAESIQVVNSMPTEPVEIHLLVEDLQARMTEKQQEDLLNTINSYCDKEEAINGVNLEVAPVPGDSDKPAVVKDEQSNEAVAGSL